MATSREEVLANFQACTSIDDVEICIKHLEKAKWDLTEALNNFMSAQEPTPLEQEVPNVSSSSVPITVEDRSVSPLSFSWIDIDQNNVQIHDANLPGASTQTVQSTETPLPSSGLEIDLLQKPGPSKPKCRLLNFKIEFRERTIPIVIPDSEDIGSIKTVLYAETGLPPCQQELRGWKKHRKITDKTRLYSLNLPKDNVLYLICDDADIPSIVNGNNEEMEECLNSSYQLNIRDETNRQNYELNFPGTKTLLEVKSDIFSLTDIPVRFQMWNGWPPGCNDSSNLADAGIGLPIHHLTLRRASESLKNSNKNHQMVDIYSSESEPEEFEDANECFTIEDDSFSGDISKKCHPLMPDDVEDECVAAHSFTQEFTNRYGNSHPMFFIGTLEEALKEACFRPARDRKQLLIYLHHDNSVLSNVFCTQALCSETVVSYITSNFIIWGWDVTSESNKTRLLSLVMQHFGAVATSSIRTMRVEQFPILLTISRSRSTNEVFSVIHGNFTLDELMTSLIHSVDVFSAQQAIETKEEDEREARESVKREQDYAYEASLHADQAKEQARRAKEEEMQRLEQQNKEDQMKMEEASRHEEAMKEAIRLSLEQQLPPEPTEDCRAPVSKIRIRLPSGEMINRRFLLSDHLVVLVNFVASKGYPTEKYKVLSSWPRRDLTSLDLNLTLETYKLYPQETVTLEER